jgi:hypothetical protein
VWEDGLAASEHALGRACMECDAERAKTEAVRQDYTSHFVHKALSQLQQDVGGAIDPSFLIEKRYESARGDVAEVQTCGLYPRDGWDLLAELEELRVHMVLFPTLPMGM